MRLCRAHLLAIAAIAGISIVASARGAYVLGTPGASVPVSFSGFDGTSGSLNANLTLTTTGGAAGFSATANTFTDSATSPSAYTTTNGVYAGVNTTDSDVGFVARVAVGTGLQLTFGVQNNTGAPLKSISVQWLEAQYQDAVATPNTLAIVSDNGTGGVSFDASNLVATQGSLSHNEWQAASAGVVYAYPLEGAVTSGSGATSASGTPSINVATYTPTGGATIANGATVDFQFTWTPGGGGNRPIFGVQDVSINSTATPEPMSIGGIGACAIIGLLKRRRRA